MAIYAAILIADNLLPAVPFDDCLELVFTVILRRHPDGIVPLDDLEFVVITCIAPNEQFLLPISFFNRIYFGGGEKTLIVMTLLQKSMFVLIVKSKDTLTNAVLML